MSEMKLAVEDFHAAVQLSRSNNLETMKASKKFMKPVLKDESLGTKNKRPITLNRRSRHAANIVSAPMWINVSRQVQKKRNLLGAIVAILRDGSPALTSIAEMKEHLVGFE